MMPATPGAHFVIAHAEFLFADLEAEFNRPSQAAEADEVGVGQVGRGVRQIGFDLAIDEAAAQHQPYVGSRQRAAQRYHTHEGKVGYLGTLTAFLNRMTPPGIGRQLLGQGQHRAGMGGSGQEPHVLRLGTTSRPGGDGGRRPFLPDVRRVGHLSKVPAIQAGDLVEQGGIVAKAFVTDDPAEGKGARLHHVLEHLPPQRGLGGKRYLLGDATRFKARGIVRTKPFFGQIEPPIQQGIAACAGVRDKDARLTIGFLAQLAALLALDPHRVLPLLGKIAPIKDQHPLSLAQLLRHFLPQTPQQEGVLPRTIGDELLQATYRCHIRALQMQDYRLN